MYAVVTCSVHLVQTHCMLYKAHTVVVVNNLVCLVLTTQDTPMTKVWYKQDDTFFVPRACINLKISRYPFTNHYQVPSDYR